MYLHVTWLDSSTSTYSYDICTQVHRIKAFSCLNSRLQQPVMTLSKEEKEERKQNQEPFPLTGPQRPSPFCSGTHPPIVTSSWRVAADPQQDSPISLCRQPLTARHDRRHPCLFSVRFHSRCMALRRNEKIDQSSLFLFYCILSLDFHLSLSLFLFFFAPCRPAWGACGFRLALGLVGSRPGVAFPALLILFDLVEMFFSLSLAHQSSATMCVCV